MSLLRCELANVLGGPRGQRYATITHPADPKLLMVLGPHMIEEEARTLLAAFITAMRGANGSTRTSTYYIVGFAPFAPGESRDNLKTIPNPVATVDISLALLYF